MVRRSSPKKEKETPCPRTRVYTIGTQSILTFEKASPNANPVEIVVEGQGMCQGEISVQLLGTIAPRLDDYDWQVETDPENPLQDTASVVLKRGYLDKVKTGDRLEVIISSRDKSDSGASRAHRIFTFYEVEDYRTQVLATHLGNHDIEAFPLPATEARYLFGKLIAENFFVVRLSMRNSFEKDILVNSGLIRATGRAIVEMDKPTQRDPSFTIPVQVSPQSPTQIYAFLEWGEIYKGWRPWTFRSLEFIGALGTATAISFGAPADLQTGISLFTGVAMPEGRKLWPDGWPGYKRNLVNFAVPELTKVPHRTTTPSKFIFFSKRELELLMADSNLFTDVSTGKKREIKTHIISIAFDNLHIPFETVIAPSMVDLSLRLAELQQANSLQIELLTSLKDTAQKAGRALEAIDVNKLTQVDQSLSAIKTNLDKIKEGDLNDDVLRQKHVVGNLQNLTSILLKKEPANTILEDTLFNAITPHSASLARLRLQTDELAVLRRRTLARNDDVTLASHLDVISWRIETSRATLRFILLANDLLTDEAFVSAFNTLKAAKPPATEEETKKTTSALSTVLAVHAQLSTARTMLAFPSFEPENFAKISPPPAGEL